MNRRYQYDDYDDEDDVRESYSSLSPRNSPQQKRPQPPPGRRQPHRPIQSSSTTKTRVVVRGGKFRQQNSKDNNDHIVEDNNINHILDGYERMPREALIASLMETKKKLISMESLVSTLKAENQRWENEISKQQKRIDKLLDTSTNRHGTSAADIRKELEKSTIVRQLKRQNHSMKNNLIDKDIELEKIKKSIKGSALMILSTEKDEYYMECLRLKEVVSKLIEENRIYKSKVKQHGKEDDQIRREVVRLSSGFQSLLESAAGVSSSVNIPATSHKKGYKSKDKFSASSPLNYFNSEIVTQDDGLQINITNNETVNVPVMSTPTVAHKGDSKSKDIFDITPSTPFPLLSSNNGNNNSTNTPNIVASSLASSKGSPPSSPVYKYRYQIGEKVQGQYKGGFNWYGATIKAASRNNDEETYHLVYDDGDEEKIVTLSHVRLSSEEQQENGNEHQQHHDQQQQQQQHHHDQQQQQQQQQHQHSPSKQLFDKYLDEISDDDDNNTKNNKLLGPKILNDNYDDDFEA